MKRKIIRIDESRCTGCGECIPGCPEGALQIIDGKARLVSDLFCDGLGACIGRCPYGAISIEEQQAREYDERKVMENIVKHGKDTIIAHLNHLKDHGETKYLQEAKTFLKEKGVDISMEENGYSHTCPGSKMMYFKSKTQEKLRAGDENKSGSQLINWPIELALINPSAPYLDNEELVIAADCTAFAWPDFHRGLLRGKVLIIFCPKLDERVDSYIEKLAHIFQKSRVKRICVVHMEVPCCAGILRITEEALHRGERDVVVEEYTVSVEGGLVSREEVDYERTT